MTHPMTADTPAAPEKNGKKAIETLERLANTPGSGSDMVLWGEHVNAVLALHAYVAALTAQLEAANNAVQTIAAKSDHIIVQRDEALSRIVDLQDEVERETARADAAVAEVKALREALEPFVRAADAAERNCFPLDGAVFRSALDYDMRALGRDNSEDVYRDSVRTSDLYRLRSIVTRATLAAAGAKEGA